MTRKFPPPAPRELVVIVDPKAGIRVRNGQVISIFEEYQANAKAMADLILAEHAKIWPLYGVSEELLLERTSKTKTMMGVGQRLDLSIFYKVTVPDDELKSMVPKLRALKVVQSAYVKPGVELTIKDNTIQSRHSNESRDGLESDDLVLGTITPPFTQAHLNSVSEGGMGVPCAWAIPGGRGAGINIIDAEGAWNFSHEDLPENMGGLIGGVERAEIGWRNHGTAVLGVLGGDSNTFGITGICPEAFVRTVSVFGNSDGTPPAEWSSDAAIIRAADNLNAGDILLLEHHLPGPRANFETQETQFGYIPIEWWPDNLAAIQYATDKGIIVVEAAGNGRQNLDDSIYNDPPESFPPSWTNPFQRNLVDSKAIVVGAGLPPGLTTLDEGLVERSREESSNFGNMVDAQGWGDGVVTSGFGGLGPNTDENRLYTTVFNGTSSAAAMVAGAVGCLQGILRARGTAPLEPLALRALLRRDDLNSAQQIGLFSGDLDLVRIGPRPDLCKLIAELTPPRPPWFLGTLFSLVTAYLRRLF